MTQQINFKDSVDSRLDWSIKEYGDHGKIAIKLTTTMTAKDVDTKNKEHR